MEKGEGGGTVVERWRGRWDCGGGMEKGEGGGTVVEKGGTGGDGGEMGKGEGGTGGCGEMGKGEGGGNKIVGEDTDWSRDTGRTTGGQDDGAERQRMNDHN
ncbi:hypothetical protein Pcinc_043843 [Petrolisthes cinctipes]|uniref:Uncharacterized protein n=1 Tax=Petrolisthes cinctipes TaxID=88211 RepID=A0AAE1EER7_PETCI|nr:hypothetical protein Pcinc_043843 [Petrolisthes cinctipes]